MCSIVKMPFISPQSLIDCEHNKWNNDFCLIKILIARNVKIFVSMCVMMLIIVFLFHKSQKKHNYCFVMDGLAKLLHCFEMNS